MALYETIYDPSDSTNPITKNREFGLEQCRKKSHELGLVLAWWSTTNHQRKYFLHHSFVAEVCLECWPKKGLSARFIGWRKHNGPSH